jgi:hypothetical protein
MSSSRNAWKASRTISTFSCDIWCRVSPNTPLSVNARNVPLLVRSATFELLRKPGGFEGPFNFGLAEAEHLCPHEFLSRIVQEPRDRAGAEKTVLDPSITVRHQPRQPSHDDDLLAATVGSINLEPAIPQDLRLHSSSGEHFVGSVPRSRLYRGRGVHELDLRLTERHKLFLVATVPGLRQDRRLRRRTSRASLARRPAGACRNRRPSWSP